MTDRAAVHRRRSGGSGGASATLPPLFPAGSPLPLALVAHAQEWSARSLESVLSVGGYAVVRAATGRQAVEVAQRSLPDVILLDAQLPEAGGVDACRTLYTDTRIGATTAIILTFSGPATRGQRLAALRAGAWECVGLPLDAEELLLKVGTYVRAKSHADAAREEGLVDGASGLYNVRGVLRRAREMGAEAYRHHRALACVVFALDAAGTDPAIPGGPEPGPGAVSALVRLFQGAVRSSDAVGRLGGREFVVLAPGTDAAGALQLASRLLHAAEAPEAGEGGTPPLRLRAGCHAVPDFGDAGIDPAEMLVRAVLALRSASPGEDTERVRFFASPTQAAG